MIIVRNLARLLTAHRFDQVVRDLAPIRPELLGQWKLLIANQPHQAIQEIAYGLAIIRVSEIAIGSSPAAKLALRTWAAQLSQVPAPAADGSFSSPLAAAIVAKACHCLAVAGIDSPVGTAAIRYLSSIQEPDGLFSAANHREAVTATSLCLVADVPGSRDSLRFSAAIAHLDTLHRRGQLPGPSQHALQLLRLRTRTAQPVPAPADDLFAPIT